MRLTTNRIFRNLSPFFGLILLVSFLSGCILAPAIESFKRAGVTEGDRQRILSENVEKFDQARFWGQSQKALAYCTPEGQPILAKILRKSKSEEKIVDTSIDNIEFLDSSYKAVVDVKVRSYKIPVYVVGDRIERQTWVFSMSDGWRLENVEIAS